jgi:hypothetical protein
MLAVLGVMWFLDTLIKRSQGITPSQSQRGFEVKTLNPTGPEQPAGIEEKQRDD